MTRARERGPVSSRSPEHVVQAVVLSARTARGRSASRRPDPRRHPVQRLPRRRRRPLPRARGGRGPFRTTDAGCCAEVYAALPI